MAERKTKKSTAKKTSSKTTTNVQAKVEDSALTHNKPLGIKRSHILIALVVISLLFLVYAFKGFFVVALVNGQPVSRLAVISELERQGGQQISDALVTKALILQEAKKKNITVSQEEINEELKRIDDLYKQQGQTLDQALEARGASKDDLIEQIRVQQLLTKMVGSVEVTDEEVTNYIEQNNEAFGGTLEEAQVREQLEAQMLEQKQTEFLENLKQQANIQYFIEY